MRRSYGVLASLVCWAVCSAAAQSFDDALNAFEHGDLTGAEATLRVLLKARPNDASSLGLLGAVLDGEKKFPEAEEAYRHALLLAPRSATVLDNYANHQMASGDAAGAHATYLKVIALDASRANANLQLASMAVDHKNGAEALRYLSHLQVTDRAQPPVQILDMQALFLAGRSAEANVILNRLSDSGNDPRLNFTAGLALAVVGKYPEAETCFSRALEGAPANFDVLYNLGLAAYHAKHLDRAREVLEAAQTQRPHDVDVLYSLATVEIDQKQLQPALQLLVEASRLDPARGNVQLALAQTASALGLYADARLSYATYLKLVPNDSSAQREYDFMLATSQEPREGLALLQRFVQDHPKDATARYEVGLLEAKTDPSDAAVQFGKALALQPHFAPARLGRGVLNLLQDNPAAALPDLEFAASQYPDNSAVLDRLGEAYTALNRSEEAVRALRKASEMAPRDGRILMHLSRALMKAGQTDEARAVLVRFRAVGPQSGNLIPLPGYVEFLSLSPEQQQARYREEVEKRLSKEPDDAALNVRYLEIVAAEKKNAEVAQTAAHLFALKPTAALAAEAGHALLEAGYYAEAKPLLEYAYANAPRPAVQVDLGTVLFHVAGVEPALAQLERVPEAKRSGNFYSARAEMLDSAGKLDSALADLKHAVSLAPQQPAGYEAEAHFLLKHGKQQEAMQLLDQVSTGLPDNREILLLKAEVFSSADRSSEAESIFKAIENRWPEWGPAYADYGAFLQSQQRIGEANAQLEIASALGRGARSQ